MPDFNSMTQAQLTAWHSANVDCDLHDMPLEEFREYCAEMYEMQNEETDYIEYGYGDL